MKEIDLKKHIWEGWTVKDFIDELDVIVDLSVKTKNRFSSITTREQLKKFCMDNQPYYKKYIPEVVDYFADIYNLS